MGFGVWQLGTPLTAPFGSVGCRAQQLAVRLQPRGVLYSKFTLVEQWENPSEREPRVFGVELGQLVEREKTATKVPLLIQKCVAEIEKRGLKVRGDLMVTATRGGGVAVDESPPLQTVVTVALFAGGGVVPALRLGCRQEGAS